MGVGGDLFSYYVDVQYRRMDLWEKIVPKFVYDPNKPYFEILVPTIDSVRYGYLMEKLLQVNRSVLFTGETGVGKSVIARALLLDLAEKTDYLPVFLNFSAQTSSKRTQEMIEAKLEKKRKNVWSDNSYTIERITTSHDPKNCKLEGLTREYMRHQLLKV